MLKAEIIAASLAFMGSLAGARTVALWPLGWDVARQCRDGRCAVSSENDLQFDKTLVCSYMTEGWGWRLPPNPDSGYRIENGSALYSGGTPEAVDFAFNDTVGKYLTGRGDFTLEGWFRFPAMPDEGKSFVIVDCGEGDHRWTLSLCGPSKKEAGSWRISFEVLGVHEATFRSLTKKEVAEVKTGWHHWALVFACRDGSGNASIRFYRDGRLDGEIRRPACDSTVGRSCSFRLGGCHRKGEVFMGSIDYCRLSDCALEPRAFLNGGLAKCGMVETVKIEAPRDTMAPIGILIPPPVKYRDPGVIHYQTGPSVAVSPKGRIWVAIMTGGATECDQNYVDLLTSGDGGATWSEPKLSLDMDGPMRTFDPAMWTDPEGRVWLFWCQCYDFWDGRGGLWASVCENPDDENAAWSAPRRLCDGVMKNKPLVRENGEWWLFVEQWQDDMSADVLRMPKDAPWYHNDTPHIGANVYRSDDAGWTWNWFSTVPIAADVRTCDEHMAVEQRDGTFRMLLRLRTGMAESRSTDGGRTWTQALPGAVRNPPARFFFGRLRSGNILLVKNGPIDRQTERRDLMAFLSEDDGKTFPYCLQLDMRKGVAYPDVSERSDGMLHCVHDFDRRNIGEIVLDKFTEADIRAGRLVTPESRLHVIVRKNVLIRK